jgi:hypothetical protein
VIAHLVERIEVAPPRRHLGRRMRCHLFVKHPIAQRLRRVDLGGALREPHLEITGNDLDDLPTGSGSAQEFGFAVSAVYAHVPSAMGAAPIMGPLSGWR